VGTERIDRALGEEIACTCGIDRRTRSSWSPVGTSNDPERSDESIQSLRLRAAIHGSVGGSFVWDGILTGQDDPWSIWWMRILDVTDAIVLVLPPE
jgi:hypothetical protein